MGLPKSTTMAETITEKLKRMHTWCNDCGSRLNNGKCRKCERAEEVLEAEGD